MILESKENIRKHRAHWFGVYVLVCLKKPMNCAILPGVGCWTWMTQVLLKCIYQRILREESLIVPYLCGFVLVWYMDVF